MTPFDFVKAASQSKQNLIEDGTALENEYVPFIVNKAFSLFYDSVLYANEMNQLPRLDRKVQFDYFLNSLRPKTRFAKWPKRIEDSDVKVVQQYYKLSSAKAVQAVKSLSKQQLDIIKKQLQEGG